MFGFDLSMRALSFLSPDFESLSEEIMSGGSPLAICAAAAVAATRRGSGPFSSSVRRIATLAAVSTSTPTSLALLQPGDDKTRKPLSHRHHHHHHRGQQRRCFANDRDPPLRRTTTNDIVGGRSTIGVFTPITASLWIERLQREEGATLPPRAAEGPLPPSASAVAVTYNFTTDVQLRELYRNP